MGSPLGSALANIFVGQERLFDYEQKPGVFILGRHISKFTFKKEKNDSLPLLDASAAHRISSTYHRESAFQNEACLIL